MLAIFLNLDIDNRVSVFLLVEFHVSTGSRVGGGSVGIHRDVDGHLVPEAEPALLPRLQEGEDEEEEDDRYGTQRHRQPGHHKRALLKDAQVQKGAHTCLVLQIKPLDAFFTIVHALAVTFATVRGARKTYVVLLRLITLREFLSCAVKVGRAFLVTEAFQVIEITTSCKDTNAFINIKSSIFSSRKAINPI